MTEILRVENLALPAHHSHPFHNISFNIKEGECVSIIAEGGMGKTNLLRLFCGLERPHEGKCHYRGTDIRSHSEKTWRAMRRDMGIVLEGIGLISHLTLAENLAYPLLTGGEKPAAIKDRLEFMLSHFDLHEWRNHHPQSLSSSTVRRALLARALIRNAKLLICDNLFDGIDSHARARLRAALSQDMKERKLALIFTAHDEEDARALGASVVRLMPKQGA